MGPVEPLVPCSKRACFYRGIQRFKLVYRRVEIAYLKIAVFKRRVRRGGFDHADPLTFEPFAIVGGLGFAPRFQSRI